MKRLALIALLLFAIPLAAAVEDGQAVYTGGTIKAIHAGALGSLDTTSPSDLWFEYPGDKLRIPYAKIDSFHYSTEAAHHLGVLPAIAVGLAVKRHRRHYIEITYHDDAGVSQVAIFEVSKRAPQSLLAILRARAPQACKPRDGTVAYQAGQLSDC